MKKLKYNCIFGGGAVRGMCYVGALRALHELNVEINSLAGSSVGAVFASLLACGYDENEIEELFFDFNFNVFRDINIGFSPDFSLSKGEVFLNWLKENYAYKLFGEKTTNSPVYFKDLKKDLYIVTTDITKNKPFVFSKKSTPEIEVAFAVRASAGMPGLMKPIKFGDSVLVDGDLSKSRAVWKTDKNLVFDDSRVLEFRLEGTTEDEVIKNPIDYFNTIYNVLSYLATSNVIEQYGNKDKFDYIVFDTKDLLFFDFSISADEKKKLIELGYSETIKYFKTTLLTKKTELIPLYQFLKDKITELKDCVNSNNYLLSYNKINEILSSSLVIFEKIDTIFNYKIVSIKEAIEKNKNNGFFSRNRINERHRIAFLLEELENEIGNKIVELKEYINLYKNNH